MENLNTNSNSINNPEATASKHSVTWDSLSEEPFMGGKNETQATDVESNAHTTSAEDILRDVIADFGGTLLTNRVNASSSSESKRQDLLRIELLETGERFADREYQAYNRISDELKRADFGAFSRTIDFFGPNTANLDRNRNESLIAFLDAKFSTDPKTQEAQDAHWQEYLNGSIRRSNLLRDALDITRRGTYISHNGTLEDVAVQLSNMRELPNDQLRLAGAYREYFDNPTKDNKSHLDDEVEYYSQNAGRGLYNLASSIAPVVDRRSELPDAIAGDLGRVVGHGYEDLHNAIMKYYDFKREHQASGQPNQVDQPSQPAKQAPHTKVSEITKRSYNDILNLVQ